MKIRIICISLIIFIYFVPQCTHLIQHKCRQFKEVNAFSEDGKWLSMTICAHNDHTTLG